MRQAYLTPDEKRAIQKQQLLDTIYKNLATLNAVDYDEESIAILARTCGALSTVLEAVGEE